jgi:hypothetical protein
VQAKQLLRFRQSRQAFHTAVENRCQNGAPGPVSAAPAETDRQINDDDIQRPNFDRAGGFEVKWSTAAVTDDSLTASRRWLLTNSTSPFDEAVKFGFLFCSEDRPSMIFAASLRAEQNS